MEFALPGCFTQGLYAGPIEIVGFRKKRKNRYGTYEKSMVRNVVKEKWNHTY